MKGGFILMDYDSIKRYGLERFNFDLNKSYETFNPVSNNHTIVLYINKDDNARCPYCNSKEISIKCSKNMKIKYASSLENNINIVLYRRVYICLKCNHYFKEINPFLSSTRSISLNKEIAILEALRDKTKTFQSVAKEFNVSPTYVMNLFDSRVDLKRLQMPLVLCIDEVYAKRLTKKSYCCILYAPQWKKIIDVLNSRHKNHLIDYFSHISIDERNKVKFISMDLWDSYRQMAKLCLPNAIICADSFHVIENLNRCFQAIRISVMHKYEHLKKDGSNFYWLFKKYNRFLLTDISNLPDTIKINYSKMTLTKYQVIEYMLELSPDLRLAYELKEEYRNFNSTANIDNALEWLNELILKFKNSRINEYITFWKLLENWHDEIVNSFNRVNGFRISNGGMERVNRDIKTIFGISFGVTNFVRVRNRIIYSINDNCPILGAKKESNSRKGKSRGPYSKKQ